ncbi:MAG: hypothetical protein IT210_03385 [Armatimonadetes bacterium]|nr:hypothetical protein [Armatimonadota bacterium]
MSEPFPSNIPYSQQDLFRAGPQRTFSGRALAEVAFPLGGIGTGTVSLGGRGQFRDWEIFNRPAKGKSLPFTFFALWARPEGEEAVACVLERRLLPPFAEGAGMSPAYLCGLPRLKEARFRGEYPFAWIDFEDDSLPLKVSLEAFNPFIPMNDRDSGIPAAVFRWTLENPTNRRVEATVAFSLINMAGYDGVSAPARHNGLLGQNLNEWVSEPGLKGIRMSSGKYGPDAPQFGTMALAAPWDDVTYKLRWERSGWFDDAQNFWDDFTADGLLSDNPEAEASPDGLTDIGTLGLKVALEPGGKAALPFILSWHFPNLTNYWNGEAPVKGKRLGNYYGTLWGDAWEAARYTAGNLPRLEGETRAFHRAFFDSTLPAPVLDAVSANASIIRTTTCLRIEDGRFHGFEGCGDNGGCCPMNCTHVWNYEQSLAHLFPALERSVRLTDFRHNTREDGSMAFRTLLPLVGELWAFKPAADGQMGTVMKVYREWLQSGDKDFLAHLWPSVKRALEFAWAHWDPDKDGVMEGEQHNTYDIEFYGPNTMMGSLYLGALRAAAEMARALGEPETAKEYRAVFEKGRERMGRELWNGEFYIQQCEDVNAYRYQYGVGCLSDQLLGAWFACVVGLGDMLPADQVRKTLGSIFRYNWKADLSRHASVQRVYALNDEKGLLLCSWPKGGRPIYPFPYADEVWTGIEYQVAAHCIYAGLIEEGLAIVKGVRARHDGERRNPWNEFECGHHYARAMSSWSLLLALSGCLYNAPEASLSFAPCIAQDDFRAFFAAGTAWGSYAQTAREASLSVRWGGFSLQTLSLSLKAAEVRLNGSALPADISSENGKTVIRFATPLTLSAGQELTVSGG